LTSSGFPPLKTLGSPLFFLDAVPPEVLERCAPMLRAISLEAPETVGGIVVITSHIREPRGAFSWHWTGDAVDWRTGIKPDRLADEPGAIVASSRDEAIEIAKAWTDRVAARLGNEFDVVGPRDAKHVDHGHAEHDGRKAARVHF